MFWTIIIRARTSRFTGEVKGQHYFFSECRALLCKNNLQNPRYSSSKHYALTCWKLVWIFCSPSVFLFVHMSFRSSVRLSVNVSHSYIDFFLQNFRTNINQVILLCLNEQSFRFVRGYVATLWRHNDTVQKLFFFLEKLSQFQPNLEQSILRGRERDHFISVQKKEPFFYQKNGKMNI